MILNLLDFRGREYHIFGVEIRIPREDGLLDAERPVINRLVRKMGYDNVNDLATSNGYSSPREMAYNYSFKNVRDFFLGKGWSDRLSKFNRTKRKEVSEKEFKAIDPNYDAKKLQEIHGKIS